MSLDVFTIDFTKCFPTLTGIMILNKFGLKKTKKPKIWTLTLITNGSPLNTKEHDLAILNPKTTGF